MRPLNLRPRTLVFPRRQDEYSYLPLLADAGVVVVRHRDSKNGVRLSYPERTPSGVYRIYESMNLRIAKRYDYLKKVEVFVREAIERQAVYSLWSHPSDPTEWFDPGCGILAYMDAERRSGRLWVATMQELAAYCEARERLQLSVEQDGSSLTLAIESSLDTSRFGPSEVTLLIPVPSTPTSAWLELIGGGGPVDVRSVSTDSGRVMVTIPATAKAVQLTLEDA